MTEPGNGDAATMRFDLTINLGHILTIAVLIAGGFAAYSSIEFRLNEVDVRTADYQRVRDLVLSSANKTDNQATQLALLAGNTQSISTSLSGMREDIASIKATLAANGRAQ